MKLIHQENDSTVFKRVLKKILIQKIPSSVWFIRSKTKEKIMLPCLVEEINFESKTLKVNIKPQRLLDSEIEFHFFCKDENIMFQAKSLDCLGEVILLNLPDEIKFLGDSNPAQSSLDSDVWKIKKLTPEPQPQTVTMRERTQRDQDFLKVHFDTKELDQEDKTYADKRSAPRNRPKKDKIVMIILNNEFEMRRFKLFDLSQGGMGVICDKLDGLEVGLNLTVIGFDEFKLDHPLYGKIMSVKTLNDKSLLYKLGIKFDAGQG